MSTGIVGTIGSLATGQLQAARGINAERATHDVANQARSEQSNELAEKAAGIGQTEREGETSERDADGRRLWEVPHSKKQADDSAEKPHDCIAKDPTGTAGTQLDLSG